MFPTKCPIMNTLPVNELGSVPQQHMLILRAMLLQAECA